MWFWKINQEVNYGRITYRMQHNKNTEGSDNGPYSIDALNAAPEDSNDIYLNSES